MRTRKGFSNTTKHFEEAPRDGWADWWYDANDDPEQEEPPGAAASPTSPTGPTTSPMATAAAEGSVGMSPIRRAQPDASFRSVGVPGTSAAGEVQGEINEFSLADSFVLGVLRGFRLLQSAGLSPDEKRDILATTKGSLEFEVVTQALQTLWLCSPLPARSYKTMEYDFPQKM